jgi:hypothetical protein
MAPSRHLLGRRDALKGLLATATGAVGFTPAPAKPAEDGIRIENARPGTRDWQLTRVRVDASGIRSPWIEFHGPPAKIPGLEVVAEGTVWRGGKVPGHWTATIFPGPKGNFVFNAATIFWAQGLSTPPGHTLAWSHWSRPHGHDPRVLQITQNLLQRATSS